MVGRDFSNCRMVALVSPELAGDFTFTFTFLSLVNLDFFNLGLRTVFILVLKHRVYSGQSFSALFCLRALC